MELCRYRPAFFTGFDEPGDVIPEWDGAMTVESVPWLQGWIDDGFTLTFEREYPSLWRSDKDMLGSDGCFQHYLMGEKNGERVVVGLAHEHPDDVEPGAREAWRAKKAAGNGT